jgi:nucleoid-associated protein YgaU
VKIVTVAGGDLFRLALARLGDATQWNRIAKLNGLSDPVLAGLITLKLPAVDPAAGGGIERS